ncbi:MAG: polyprenyl diphosphate synthase [Nitrososphaerota archaeon]|nr:polyprenyl diphosphate synthase [Nitrososphaerota archaeon]
MIERSLQLLGVYKLYERLLLRKILRSGVPQHLAVILDGNRRWASMSGLAMLDGYRRGAEKVDELLEWCFELGIKVITLYVLSLENMKLRSGRELDLIYRLLVEKSEQYQKDRRITSNKVRIRVIGRKWMLPPHVREALERLEEKTSSNDSYYINVAVAYGGRAEIVDAIKAIVDEVRDGKISLESLDEDKFATYLYTNGVPYPYPDLVIRTSGTERISNFLLWQIAYSELVFLEVYWPELRKIDLLRAIRTYQERSRNFGA